MKSFSIKTIHFVVEVNSITKKLSYIIICCVFVVLYVIVISGVDRNGEQTD